MNFCLAVLAPFVILGCSSESPNRFPGTDGPTGGRGPGSGGMDGEGLPATGGATNVGGTGGATSSGGASSSGGAASATGGASSSGGGTGEGQPRPSAGCGMGGRPAEGVVYDAGKHWIVFPPGYDGSTPLAAVFAFHGCGASNFGNASRTQFTDAFRNTEIEANYILVAPLASSGSCWDYDVDIPKVKALYTELAENYCVNLDRVFATGSSSGSGTLMTMTAADRTEDFQHFGFKGIAPIAGWQIWNQASQVPTMYIQGVTDSERGGGDGKDAVDKIVEVNGCSMTTSPLSVSTCNSSHDGDAVDAGCRSYSGCGAETVWCSHDDSAYSGTFHGIPCFYQEAVYDFFEGL